MRCPRCGDENSGRARFCQGCGAVLSAAAPAAPRVNSPRRSAFTQSKIVGCGVLLLTCVILNIVIGLTSGTSSKATGSATSVAVAAVTTTSVPATTTPVPPTATPDRDQLVARLGAAWTNQDWPTALQIAWHLHDQYPDDPAMSEKLTAASVNAGLAAEQSGDLQSAIKFYETGGGMDNPEIAKHLLPLLPTATPLSHLGRPFTGNNWVYTVTDVTRADTFTWSAFGNRTRPNGQWLIVRLSLKNIGPESWPINTSDFHLFADGVRYSAYDALDQTEWENLNGLSHFGTDVPPGVTVKSGLLFDINPAATNLSLYLEQEQQSIVLTQ